MNPRVSIGLPVFNGENYLAQALDSLLGQTFGDFEIIVSDNASSDGTADIVNAYAGRDPRIRYCRNDANVGSARNFNSTFERARGQYFKWAAHDDVVAPTYLEHLVQVLDDDAGAVLASSEVRVIDPDGHEVDPAYDVHLQTDSPDPATRFREIIRGAQGHMCYEVFGLMRRGSLARTCLMANCPHGDGVLLAFMALLGRFIEVPQPLFFPRRHPQQASSSICDRERWAEWFDPRRQGRIMLPYWRIFSEYGKAIRHAGLSGGQRSKCTLYLVREGIAVRRRLMGELLAALRTACHRRKAEALPDSSPIATAGPRSGTA